MMIVLCHTFFLPIFFHYDLVIPWYFVSQMSIWKKANLVLLFFLLRKLILPFYSFTLFCIILPLTMFVPEAELPVWVICYVPVFMSFLNILPAPRSFPFIVPYLLFENTMSVTKFNAMVSGLFQLGSSYEWVVTKKAGRSSESDLVAAAERESKTLSNSQLYRGASESELSELNRLKEQPAAPPPIAKTNKIYRKELALAFLLLIASVRSLLSAQGVHFYFLLFQGVSFLLVGLDLIGEQMSWCKGLKKKTAHLAPTLQWAFSIGYIIKHGLTALGSFKETSFLLKVEFSTFTKDGQGQWTSHLNKSIAFISLSSHYLYLSNRCSLLNFFVVVS